MPVEGYSEKTQVPLRNTPFKGGRDSSWTDYKAVGVLLGAQAHRGTCGLVRHGRSSENWSRAYCPCLLPGLPLWPLIGWKGQMGRNLMRKLRPPLQDRTHPSLQGLPACLVRATGHGTWTLHPFALQDGSLTPTGLCVAHLLSYLALGKGPPTSALLMA